MNLSKFHLKLFRNNKDYSVFYLVIFLKVIKSILDLKVIGKVYKCFIRSCIYVIDINICQYSLHLRKVTHIIHYFPSTFCVIFTAVAIIFHSIIFVTYLSCGVTGSMNCKQILTFEAVQFVFHKHNILSLIVFITIPCQASVCKVKLLI